MTLHIVYRNRNILLNNEGVFFNQFLFPDFQDKKYPFKKLNKKLGKIGLRSQQKQMINVFVTLTMN
jgi:hypothetical protein